MPHISKIKMAKSISDTISNEFIKILTKANKESELSQIIKEMLTKTEKIMLAKRIAIILLLDKNIPQHQIVDLLKVSYTTVAKISLEIEKGQYKNIIKTSKNHRINIEKLIWDILTVGGIMPPKIGYKSYLAKQKK